MPAAMKLPLSDSEIQNSTSFLSGLPFYIFRDDFSRKLLK